MKVLDLIVAAERSINALAVSDDLQAAEAAAAFTLLNSMLDEWNNQKYACFQLVTDVYQMVGGKGVYTIGEGAGADWVGPRPVEIDSMFARDSRDPNNKVDYNIALVTNEQYQKIMLKSVTSTYPYLALYTPSYPNATFTFFPYPTIPLYFNLTRWSQVSAFKALTDDVSFPPGYQLALQFGLAQLLPSLGHNPPASVMGRVDAMAAKYMASIKRVNAKEPIIAGIDFALTGRQIGFPNILTG